MRTKMRIPVTIIILLLNIAGMIYEYTQGQRLILYRYGMYQGALADGEYIRLIASLIGYDSHTLGLLPYSHNLRNMAFAMPFTCSIGLLTVSS